MDIKENFKGHLSTINHHKMEVMRLCFKVGLYKQGLMHDLSKYSPKEFISGVVFYTGDKSPNTTERRVTGKSEAWLHHKGRNRHHFEYWIDYGQEPGSAMQGMKMPVSMLWRCSATGWRLVRHIIKRIITTVCRLNISTRTENTI